MLTSVDVCDAGDEVMLTTKYTNGYDKDIRREVVMTVTVPRGRLVLFNHCICPDRQVEAVRRFMEQHRE